MRRFDGDDAPGLRAGSVGNGDDRAVGGHAPERLQHGVFSFRIQVGRDLIQQQDARIGGCGAGDALVRAAVEHAARIGAGKVMLTSNPAREAARALYRKVGFEEVETTVFAFKTDK